MANLTGSPPQDPVLERLSGIVERVTFHNEQNGWSVLKVASFRDPSQMATVLVHQAKVFAGATMEFWGSWGRHPKHGDQFNAVRAIEKKPATAAGLEKYLGSGMIKGVGPATARRIVAHFKDQTLDVFESRIEDLMGVPGIAEKKLQQIKASWQEHRSIRDVMIFLQSYGVSTLYATKIYKAYGDDAIAVVSQNPYRLAHDIYGIGFFSADRIALAMGFDRAGLPRVEAGIKHVLAASRKEGHCFLTRGQIVEAAIELLREDVAPAQIADVLQLLLTTDQVKQRTLKRRGGRSETVCYYCKGLYFDELTVATQVKGLLGARIPVDGERIRSWIAKYCEMNSIELSDEQMQAVCGLLPSHFQY